MSDRGFRDVRVCFSFHDGATFTWCSQRPPRHAGTGRGIATRRRPEVRALHQAGSVPNLTRGIGRLIEDVPASPSTTVWLSRLWMCYGAPSRSGELFPGPAE